MRANGSVYRFLAYGEREKRYAAEEAAGVGCGVCRERRRRRRGAKGGHERRAGLARPLTAHQRHRECIHAAASVSGSSQMRGVIARRPSLRR